MSFKQIMDGYIDECLEEGVLPDASTVIQEVDVAGQQQGPRDGEHPGKFAAGPPGAGTQASFKDHDAPPTGWNAPGRRIPPARFSEQNRATPPARFTNAARMSGAANEDEEVLDAVFADLEALEDSDGLGFSVEEGGDLAGLLDSEIEEAVVARGMGAVSRKAPEMVGKWAKRYGRNWKKSPVRMSITPGIAGAGGAGYYRSKEKKAAERGDKAAVAKYARRRKIATAAASIPLAAISAKAGIAAAKHARKGRALTKEIAGKKAPKVTKDMSRTAKRAVKKDARSINKLRDTRAGHAMMATGAGATAAALGTHTAKRVGKKWERGDEASAARLKSSTKRRRAIAARRQAAKRS